ncbi:hypothetical protein CEXT_550091 [Caerostris extrusa]|uniref:Uncharacterized protein n=1 Tax=Caerostris extrusa TaxID=172846 RepID=A0AAV4TGZ8_CAEEX|nr:hypothetical protein CEXT_550091 [Caerostris extrusa]
MFAFNRTYNFFRLKLSSLFRINNVKEASQQNEISSNYLLLVKSTDHLRLLKAAKSLQHLVFHAQAGDTPFPCCSFSYALQMKDAW